MASTSASHTNNQALLNIVITSQFSLKNTSTCVLIGDIAAFPMVFMPCLLIMANMLMMMMTMTVAEPSLSGSLVLIVWKNEEGGSTLVGGQICTQRIPRVHTFDILARGGGHGGRTETEHPLFF